MTEFKPFLSLYDQAVAVARHCRADVCRAVRGHFPLLYNITARVLSRDGELRSENSEQKNRKGYTRAHRRDAGWMGGRGRRWHWYDLREKPDRGLGRRTGYGRTARNRKIFTAAGGGGGGAIHTVVITSWEISRSPVDFWKGQTHHRADVCVCVCVAITLVRRPH